MKYLKALAAKKLKVTSLPKGVQKKIEQLSKVVKDIEEFKKDGLDELEIRELEFANQRVKKLDEQIEKAVKRFDPADYKKKLERINEIRALRNKKDSPSVPPVETKAVEEVIVQPVVQLPVVETQHSAVQNQAVQTEVPKRTTQEISDDLDELKKSVKIKPEQIESPTKEVEEFEKAADAKPKKISTSVIMMGIGAFILTWGAVNFFKERSK